MSRAVLKKYIYDEKKPYYTKEKFTFTFTYSCSDLENRRACTKFSKTKYFILLSNVETLYEAETSVDTSDRLPVTFTTTIFGLYQRYFLNNLTVWPPATWILIRTERKPSKNILTPGMVINYKNRTYKNKTVTF